MYCAFLETTGLEGSDGVSGTDGVLAGGVCVGGVCAGGAGDISSSSVGGRGSVTLLSGDAFSLFSVEGKRVSFSLQAIKAGKRERDKRKAVNVFIRFII